MSTIKAENNIVLRYDVDFIQNLAEINYDIPGKTTPELEKIRKKYLNPSNKAIKSSFFQVRPENKRTKFFKQNSKFSDDYYVDGFRKILSGCSTFNLDQNVNDIGKLTLPPSCYKKISQLFHTSMINGINIIDVYFGILDRIKIGQELKKMLYNIVEEEFDNPTEFNNTIAETSNDKNCRWRKNNLLIMSHMCMRGELMDFPSKLIDLIDSINSENISYSSIITKDTILSIIEWLAKNKTKYSNEINKIIMKLTVVTEDVRYRLTPKLQLKCILQKLEHI